MFVKKLLYKSLPLKSYLRTVSRLYFVLFGAGLLRGRKAFDYPYFLKHILNPGDTAIDIGANLGYYTVPIARAVGRQGRQGRVYAVEPIKEIREVLEYNTRKFNNITIVSFALGIEEATIRMGNDSPGSRGYMATGVNMVLDENTGAEAAAMEFTVSMRRGSELFGDLAALEFIKCDVEGYETVVIPEMKPVLEKFHPTVLMETGGTNREKMITFMETIGYAPYILKGKHLHRFPPDTGEDILFIHGDKLEKYGRFVQ